MTSSAQRETRATGSRVPYHELNRQAKAMPVGRLGSPFVNIRTNVMNETVLDRHEGKHGPREKVSRGGAKASPSTRVGRIRSSRVRRTALSVSTGLAPWRLPLTDASIPAESMVFYAADSGHRIPPSSGLPPALESPPHRINHRETDGR